jgi:hypothetical protein
VIADPGSWVEKERWEYRVAGEAKGRAAQVCVRRGMGSMSYCALVRDVGNGGFGAGGAENRNGSETVGQTNPIDALRQSVLDGTMMQAHCLRLL